MKDDIFLKENIEIYIKYDHLLAEQLATITTLIDQVFNLVVLTLRGAPTVPDLFLPPPQSPIPLCIENAKTGNSIIIKYSLSKSMVITSHVNKDKDLEICLPTWAAYIAIAVIILKYGLSIQNDYFDGRLKKLEIEEREAKIIKEQSNILMDKLSNPKNTILFKSMNSTISSFNHHIRELNIEEVQINNTVVHNRSQFLKDTLRH